MTEGQSSHKQILKATGVVGGAQIISILIRIIRVKVIAVLLGPAGVGIAGLYQSTITLVQNATSLGLGFSAVRDVAEADGTGDQRRVGRTITILRRWVWLTGLLGMAVLLVFQKEFSRFAFKDSHHAVDFLILSIVPLFAALSGGQMAMLRGIRRIGDMARAGVLGAAAGLCVTVPLYWWMGLRGIVPAIILTALIELVLSWYFARRIAVSKVPVDWRETISGGKGMIKLGFFTVITGFATTGTMYLVRIFLADRLGVDGVGQFQAAWSLSETYVGLVLGAMGADYFPRLSAVNFDNSQVNRLVNEQTEIALLIAGPVLIGMMCFMDIIVALFYSHKFGQSIDILYWQTLGNLLKVILWPMAFVLLAKGRGSYFIIVELLWNVFFLASIWFLWPSTGIVSTGISFFIAYSILTLVVYGVCKRICNFSWSKKSLKAIVLFSILSLMAFVNILYKIPVLWRAYGIVLIAVATIYSYNELSKIISLKQVVSGILNKLGLHKTQ